MTPKLLSGNIRILFLVFISVLIIIYLIRLSSPPAFIPSLGTESDEKWEIYKNYNPDFTVEYPTSWIVEVSQAACIDCGNPYSIGFGPKLKNQSFLTPSIMVSYAEKSSTIDQYLKACSESQVCQASSVEDTTINGVPAKKLTFPLIKNAVDENFQPEDYIMKKDKYLITIRAIIQDSGTENNIDIEKRRKTFDRFISTFKFQLEFSKDTANTANNSKTQNQITWKEYSSADFSKKIEFWAGFKLIYPSTWAVAEMKNEAEPPSLIVKLSNSSGDFFEIIQGSGGGGYCLFPYEADYSTFQGNGTKYSKYIEINKTKDIVWRLAERAAADDTWTHDLCEKRTLNGSVRFFDSTKIGFTKIRATTSQSVQDLKDILNKLEIVK